MEKVEAKIAIEELTMILMYLTRFVNDPKYFPDDDYAWKGHDFSAINALANKEYIVDGTHPYKTKKVYLTDEGKAYAKVLLEKYKIDDWK